MSINSNSNKMNDIVNLKCLIKNVDIKLSTVTFGCSKNQILCIVLKNNDLIFRYISETGDIILKKISWFQKHCKIIQDICFDPTGTWLLVFCLDNTIHIVPALNIVDKSLSFKCIFSSSEITSFVVPFIGPHECKDSQKCPNHNISPEDGVFLDKQLRRQIKRKNSNSNMTDTLKNNYSTTKVNELITSNAIYNTFYCDQQPNTSLTSPNANNSDIIKCDSSTQDFSNIVSLNNEKNLSANNESKCTTPTAPSQMMSCSMSSFVESSMISSATGSTNSISTCPIPMASIWWRTQNDENRAILGYSDGSICVVLLTNNCPFIGNTSIEKGPVEKFFICRDTNLDGVTLMINTTTQEQYKLLLEQKSNGYVFPNENAAAGMHIPSKSHCENEWEFISSSSTMEMNVNVEKSLFDSGNDSAGPSNDEAMTLQQKIFPAAKARLLSLRDLGAKKIGTLKLKLAESRIKAREKEKLKESTSSFSMINSPTINPELLTTPSGPFFVVQKAQNKNLMSALHFYSDTLSIHNIDISLIPLNLYKLPSQTRDALLTDNVLYVIQNVPCSPTVADNDETNTKQAETPSETGSSKTISNTRRIDSIDENLKSIASSVENVQMQSASVTPTATTNTSSHEENDNINNNLQKNMNLQLNDSYYNAISVISCSLSSMKIGEDNEFQERALLGTFKFPSNERILNIHRMTSAERDDSLSLNEQQNQQLDNLDPNGQTEIKSCYSKYLDYSNKAKIDQKFTDADKKCLRNEFPKINFDKCFVVTDRNVYCIELKDKPHIIFLNMASQSLWNVCDDFCKTFNLNLPECVEFAGDIFLKKKRIEQALLTYNMARIPPIKTALKLAMFNEVNALRQITAMALKIAFILESKYPMNPLIERIIMSAKDRHVKSDTVLKSLKNKNSTKYDNTGRLCSDYSYENDEVIYDIQMSNSAQFHLSNLLFLTLCEKTVRDKNYMPLWNFIVTNNKYHTSLSSIILSQSGLFSTAILLAMHRGACLDVFSCLVSASDHVIDISNEIAVMLFNLSEEIFMESITYLQNYALDYFEIIRSNLEKLDETVLERLEKQLNPFDPVYRPILSKVKNQNMEKLTKDIESKFVEFCKTFIETYILILIRLQKLRQHKDSFLNALNLFRVTSEERQNYIKLINYSPLSAGFSHCGCVADKYVYLWGTSGVNCAYSKNVLQTDSAESETVPTRLEFFKDINLEVNSVYCGRSHTLFMTNNGLYAMGLNQLGQLGIGQQLSQALQPMLIKSLDNKSITQICAGQHHNAVVADGKLYTWGWNIYGQLGHCDIYTVYEPKLVEFFRNKKIKQISLGQAHTLVLCYEKCGNLSTSLYVFGSNHYGQLGVGQSLEDLEHNPMSPSERKKNFVKCSIPLRLNFDENIRLIHTKYFTNFAVTESNRLYTWGLSPPELRIINQTKKRAKASQKIKESMKTDVVEEESKSKSEIYGEDVTAQVAEEKQENNQPGNNELDVPASKDVPAIKIDECKSPNIQEPEVATIAEEKDDPADDPFGNMEEYIGHLFPSEVDTFEVDGDIIYLSSGIYHNALITTQSSLYVWGKNIERQLGRESVKPDLFVPTKHHILHDVRFVECGADFTLVITNDNELKAFGNNNQGQCGVENSNEKQVNASKLIRFKSSKRVFRIPETSLYIDKPITVKVPFQSHTSIINFSSNQPICYLKNLPKFKRNSVIESSLFKSIRKDISEDIYDEIDQNLMNNNSSLSSLSSMTSNSSSKSSMDSTEIAHMNQQLKYSNDFIHYCLYIFQGLYDENHFYDYFYQIQRGNQLASDGNGSSVVSTFTNEYKIRILMLNYNYIDAFKLALHNYRNESQISIKIFEYFTTDSNIIPMNQEDIKYFIYDIFLHFIRNHLDLNVLESYLLENIDYYLLQLCFILYFSNNNNNNNNNQTNGLEKQLFEKFKHLYSNYENFTYFECTDLIFKSISTKFHCVLCQHLLKYSENFN